MTEWTMLIMIATPANWPRNCGISASMESASRSTTRSRNWRHKTRYSSGRRESRYNPNLRTVLRMDQVRNLPRHRIGVLFDCELREDAFECRQLHERAQAHDGVVSHKFAAMEDHDARADALHGVQFMRAEEDHFAAIRELLDEAAQNESRTNIEAREGLVEQNEFGIVHESGGDEDLL